MHYHKLKSMMNRISNLEIASKLKENPNVQTSLAEIFLKKETLKKQKK